MVSKHNQLSASFHHVQNIVSGGTHSDIQTQRDMTLAMDGGSHGKIHQVFSLHFLHTANNQKLEPGKAWATKYSDTHSEAALCMQLRYIIPMDTLVQKAVHPYTECIVSKFRYTYIQAKCTPCRSTNLMAGIFIFPVLLKSGSRAPFLSRRYKMPVYIEHNIIRIRHTVPYKYTWCMCMFGSLASE